MKPRDVFGEAEALQAAPTEEVRHWDQALIAGALTFGLTSAACIGGLWAIGHPTFPRGESLSLAMESMRYVATLGRTDSWPWEVLRSDSSTLWRIGASLVLSGAITTWIVWKASQPQSRVRHIDGPQLREGKEAKLSCRMLADKEPFLYLHPFLPLRKQLWTKHMLIVGSVGSGKTQILWGIVKQIVGMGRHGKKMILYDVKGDWTAALPEAALVSPHDARSYAWDISADLRTEQAASTFAQAMIPTKEGDFWSGAAQTVLTGIIVELIHELQHNKTPWGFEALKQRLQLDPYELKDLLAKYYPAGLRLLADPSSTTALNVLQTVTAHTRVISQLAKAWGDGKGRKKLSFRKWARDDYKGRRQIILQATSDADLTRRYIAAILNTLIPHVISPTLPDNELGRTLAFVLDEFTSIGKVDIAPLIDKGRSKGCVVILGFQAIDQVKELYGNNWANGIFSMVGTQVVCQTSMGETQNTLANLFGKRRVSLTTYSRSASGVSVSQHEEQRQVVTPSVIGTQLGPFKLRKPTKAFPNAFGIRALVSINSDPLLLEFPGESMPKLRPEFVAASSSLGVSKIEDSAPEALEDDEYTPAPLQLDGPKRVPDALDELRERTLGGREAL